MSYSDDDGNFNLFFYANNEGKNYTEIMSWGLWKVNKEGEKGNPKRKEGKKFRVLDFEQHKRGEEKKTFFNSTFFFLEVKKCVSTCFKV